MSDRRFSIGLVDVAMLLLTIATVVLAGGSLWAAVHYGRRSVREAKSANTLAGDANALAREAHALAGERSLVKWQVGRQTRDNAGLFYLMNVGEDPAHDVRVLAWTGEERAEAEADVIAPYSPDKIDANPPGYIEFRLPKREANGPKPINGPRLFEPPKKSGAFYEDFLATQRELDEILDGQQRQQVAVRVRWRSAGGRWSSQDLKTG